MPEPPDPPGPTWWEKWGEHVKAFSIAAAMIAAAIKFGSCMNESEKAMKAKQKADRIETFNAATAGCDLAERTHGKDEEVVYRCGERLERFPAFWEAEAKE
jgi:glucose-6-phosphate isomerase